MPFGCRGRFKVSEDVSEDVSGVDAEVGVDEDVVVEDAEEVAEEFESEELPVGDGAESLVDVVETCKAFRGALIARRWGNSDILPT